MFVARFSLTLVFTLAIATSCDGSAAPETGSGDDSAGEPGDGPGPQVCPSDAADAFSWSWSYGDYTPQYDEANENETSIDLWAPDGAVPLECSATAFSESDDVLTLDLDCTAAGAAIPAQQLTLSPIPEALRADLDADEPLEVLFRPQPQCNNGCNFFWLAGWLAIRHADDGALRLGIVDAHDLLAPVDELAPLELSTAVTSCERIDDETDCDPDGWARGLDVTVALDGEQETIARAGQASVGGFRVLLDNAIEGAYDGCTSDGGERALIELMVYAED